MPIWLRLEKELASLRFAVCAMILFALFMTVGTFVESYYGTEYANRLIYKSWAFMGLQAGLFLSIFLAALVRLPPKKRLYGFYTVHLGLILIGAGSFITYHAGVDGQIVLNPKDTVRHLRLDTDRLNLKLSAQGKQFILDLPSTALEQNLNKDFQGIKIKRYLPYAQEKLNWVSEDLKPHQHSSSYLITNAFTSQDFTLSLYPQALDFESTATLGPLQIHYVPYALKNCFSQMDAEKLIIWDKEKNICFTPKMRKIPVKKTQRGWRFLAFKENNKVYSFFPDQAPYPLDENLVPIQNPPYRILGLGMFEKGPQLFLFGKGAAFFTDGTWQVIDLNEGQEGTLPWMNAQIKLLEHHQDSWPQLTPVYHAPKQENGELKEGGVRALEVVVEGKTYWAKNTRPLEVQVGQETMTFTLGKKTERLPFELSLDDFKMEKDPGTNRAASYESFIDLFTKDGHSRHHVFMNNPLKYRGFTFYQASYFPTETGQFGSVLSVNRDPGRPWKYLGSLLLVGGAIAHFLINRKRKVKEARV